MTGILADLRLDTTTLTAALLHDTVEDTDVGLGDIEEEFGNEVARIVDGLTKLDKLEFRSGELAQAENVRKMIVAMAGDIRVLLVKLADRLHNMRTLSPLSEPRQHKIANETLEIHAPLADRLGVQELKWELEDLAFKTLNPGPYREIANLVETRRDERQKLLEEVKGALRAKLKELGVKADVEGRPKHLYSIYEKMVIRGKEFNEIHDLVGLRVLVPSLRDCYGALGAVHALWKPVPGRFKDYVAMPKSNMYQSLHTTVVGPKGIPLEIQIRTVDMHRTARFGIAAHWRYKEGSKSSKEAQDMAWLGQMMDWLKEMADPQEFMEGLRIDLSGGRVFCFTPKGDVQNLPQGATPVDFAYSIHTEVGHRTIGAKVNGKLVPLDYELRTGDTVDILTSKAQGRGPEPGLAPVREDPAGEDEDPAVVQPRSPRGRDGVRSRRRQGVRPKAGPDVQAARDRGDAQARGGGPHLSRPGKPSTSRWGRARSLRSRSWRGCRVSSPGPPTRTSPRCRSRGP